MSGTAEFDPSTLDNHAYKLLVKEVKDIAIFFLNPKGEIVSWNDGAARMKGYSEQEIIGQHYRILFTDEDKSNKKPEKELEEAKEKGYYTEEGFRRRKGGVQFRAHITLTRQVNENGKLLGFFKITRDITERYYREKEAELKAEEIERLSRLKDEFIGIASHELKNPLSIIKAYMQLLKQAFAADDNVKKQYKDYITKSHNQLKKLEKLINEMLNASRVGADKMQLNRAEFNLCELVAEAVENTKRIYLKHAIELSTAAVEIRVMADRDRIEQVIVNYLTNAIRYSPEGSKITVTVRTLPVGNAEVSVKDQGIGISKKDQEKVFNRFFRS